MENNPIIFSGIQPSGSLHLGNYLGAIKNWVQLQESHNSFFCVVDLHAITTPQDPQELRKRIIEVAKIYLAAGIDPAKSTIFVQSDVTEHTELAWLLNTITQNGDLTKMTQFKQKSGADFDKLEKYLTENAKAEISNMKEKTNKELKNIIAKLTLAEFKNFKEQFNSVSVGLYDYPVLMAADILLYNTDLVPVGKDQEQHIELTRRLARRFNDRFGETFKIPEKYTKKEGKRIMGLDDPNKKMSKSAPSEYNRIDLLDSADEIRNKIKKAVTDSGNTIEYTDERPAIKNLLNIFSLTSDKTPEELVTHFKGKGFKEFKEELAESIVAFLSPFQERYNAISDENVQKILDQGKTQTKKIATGKLEEVKQKMGL
ncbi:tryptophan--tRNA ligase [bacterium]|mgnify:CR=1 FL=1|jgi:tryptophanyl-tRNA synthetase|nr:tryptophan--tRNA ligase [bacterium]MBT4250936.1 tryptophan--tRNA ligase [bacterium]MBT4597876.1 tryptophan--tRNA ligase [bacterium]MBT6753932.1 tryptophan--tRNA ligase [bacterium]MBT7037361.1 tryptophan--tRNA ligase [bacterium]